jgi:hypothetical protein
MVGIIYKNVQENYNMTRKRKARIYGDKTYCSILEKPKNDYTPVELII